MYRLLVRQKLVSTEMCLIANPCRQYLAFIAILLILYISLILCLDWKQHLLNAFLGNIFLNAWIFFVGRDKARSGWATRFTAKNPSSHTSH